MPKDANAVSLLICRLKRLNLHNADKYSNYATPFITYFSPENEWKIMKFL